MTENYCSQLLTSGDDGMSLDTGLNPREAAQSKLPQYLKENGYAARFTDGSWTFTPWTWDDTKTAIPQGRKTESVFVTGPAWEGVPLYSLIDAAMAPDAAEPQFTRAVEALNLVNAAVEAAFAAGTELPLSGPAGIFTGTGSNKDAVLFMPAELFLRALQSRGEADKSQFRGIWVNDKLSGLDAWRFTLSACAFALLYGTPAYGNLNTELRIEDYLDKNHIPLQLCVEGQKPALLSAVEHNIDQQGAISKRARKGQKTASDAIVARETVNSSYSVEMPALEPFSSRRLKDPETLPQWQSFKRRLKRIRFVRKYQNAIKIGVVALAAILIVGGTIIRDRRDAPTTAGLTSDQVVEMYYKGLDTLDTSLFDAARYKKAGKGWSNYISTLFVTSKMRENYESIHTWTPGQWLYISNPAKASVFGITNLDYTVTHSLDSNGAEYETSFYLINLSMGGELTVSRYTCSITVDQVHKNLRVVEDTSVETEIPVDLETFLADLSEAVASADSYAVAESTAAALRVKYPWMPSETDLARGLQQLESGEYQ